MASSSKSSIRENFKYHVFLSFRGEDTRTTFVDHLYASLKRIGIHTFRDNEELEKGKRIDELFKAIQASKFFIIVFSRNYASSSWCLKELAKIMECQDGNERIAYPLFHNVDPSDIRKQSGPVGRAIAKHKTGKQIIKTWKKALEDAGSLVGWDLKKIANGHEAEAIDQIVKQISVKLRSIHVSKDENLVGMESRIQNLESSLGIGLDDEVRMIGIKGMGGIGKTTLSRAIFQKLSSQFEGKSFVENVREASKAQGLLSLLKQVLRDVLRDDSVNSVQEAISMMKDRMPLKKVLLVLDDVDHIDQLEALAGDWFKGGSRIIITTRNEQMLKAHRVNTGWIHDINLLSDEEAFSLFSRYAFKKYIPDEGYEELSSEVVSYAAGLPLTLKVLGSFLLGKEMHAWEDTLNRLKEIPEKETLDKLEISYDGLEDDYKEMFLDVACFMKGMRKKDAIRMLESCGFHAIIGLTVLQDRSLITISNDDELDMHDSIQELGRNIVRRSHPGDPNKHSRLWIGDEIEALLSDDEITEAPATCISMTWLNLSPEIIMKGLGKLKNLRALQICGIDDDCLRDNWMSDQDNFPNSLRYLNWWIYPGRSLPQTFLANNLVGLELPHSRITTLWESGEGKVLKKLRFLDLSNSMVRTLDVGMTPNLESLDLYGCRDLTEIHASARCLERLVYLNLKNCSRFTPFSFIKKLDSLDFTFLAELRVTVKSLNEFTGFFCDNLPELKITCFYVEEQASRLENSQRSVILGLQPGTKLESVSGSFFGLRHLRHLTFDGCIPELPNDLDQLANLAELNLESTKIKCLPDSICMLKHLKSLHLTRCLYLEELPRDLGQLVCLENLTLGSTNIKCLPDSICKLKYLKSLQLDSEFLEELPRDLGQLVCLEKLNLVSTSIKCLPDSICMLKNLKSLILVDCMCLEELPRDLGQLVCLEHLILSSECIKYLPDSICMLKHLESIMLKVHHLEELPRDLDHLVCLEYLYLFSASIKHLPDSICMMKNLNYLDLIHCRCLEELPRDLGQLVCLEKLSLESTNIKCLPDSICMLKHLKSLELESCYDLEVLPRDLGRLVCLEKLNLVSTSIKCLPDSICMMKHLKSLRLIRCWCLEKLPTDLGQLECLEELILYDCKILEDIPNSICNMKRLKRLDIKSTGIRHLPQSISSLEGLRIVGSEEVLQSCVFATEIQTSEYETFCYIQAVDNTEAETGLENQFTENLCNRWRWSLVVLGTVGLLVRQVMQARVSKKKVKL